jgi:hypothetical protein
MSPESMGHDLTAETTPTPRAARWSGWPTGSWMPPSPTWLQRVPCGSRRRVVISH